MIGVPFEDLEIPCVKVEDEDRAAPEEEEDEELLERFA